MSKSTEGKRRTIVREVIRNAELTTGRKVSLVDAELIVGGFLEELMHRALERPVLLTGIGLFRVSTRKARKRVNPQTKAIEDQPATYRVVLQCAPRWRGLLSKWLAGAKS